MYLINPILKPQIYYSNNLIIQLVTEMAKSIYYVQFPVVINTVKQSVPISFVFFLLLIFYFLL